jgi:uncharacterized cupredoxin-like copper-binding protein
MGSHQMFDLKAKAVPLALTLGFLTSAAAFADGSAVVEVMMTNKSDGSQVMSLSESAVHAGIVVFKVMNHSPDTVHEFLVVKTDMDPDALPMSDDGTKLDEDKLQGIQELGDLDPGKSGEMKMTLAPGHYLLFCNEPGHFKAGMHASFSVSQ